jgi:uncharacterized membrane protein YfcA
MLLSECLHLRVWLAFAAKGRIGMLVLAVLMFVVAVAFSIVGQGGGVLFTPIQVWSGVDFHTAATTSLFLIMIMSLSTSIVFRRAKRIDWSLVMALEASSAVGGFLGGLSSTRFSGTVLTILFSVVVAVAGMLMIRFFPTTSKPRRVGKSTISWRRRTGEEEYDVNLVLALPISLVAGLVSGLVGVGGGILKVPMMVLLLGIPIEIAVGSSALMVGITAAAGFAGHVANGHWDWRTSVALALAVFLGGQVGSRISIGLEKKRLQKGFGYFLMVLALLMVLRAVLGT